MAARYATKECSVCGLRRPVPYMKRIERNVRSGNSGISFSFNPNKKNSSRIYSGRAHYRKKVFWECAEKAAHNDPTYFERKAAEEAEEQRQKAIIDAENKRIEDLKDRLKIETNNLIFTNFKDRIEALRNEKDIKTIESEFILLIKENTPDLTDENSKKLIQEYKKTCINSLEHRNDMFEKRPSLSFNNKLEIMESSNLIEFFPSNLKRQFKYTQWIGTIKAIAGLEFLSLFILMFFQNNEAIMMIYSTLIALSVVVLPVLYFFLKFKSRSIYYLIRQMGLFYEKCESLINRILFEQAKSELTSSKIFNEKGTKNIMLDLASDIK